MAMMEAAAGRVLILKRAAANRPSGDWNDDDYDVLADGGRCRPHLEGSRGPGGNAVDVDAGLWPSRGPHADVRLRGVARDRDGGLRRELAAGTKKRRTYLPRIVGDKVMMPADLKRLHKYVLEVEHIGVSIHACLVCALG